jgi:beta-glucosidase
MTCVRTPICDLARDARWGRCGECFGEDPGLVGALAAAVVRGLGGRDLSRADAVVSELRHFIHAAPELGTNGTAAPIGERELQRLYVPPFREAIRAGALGIMAAYNAIDNLPCHANRHLLFDILRAQCGFEGFTQSDATGIRQLQGRYRMAADAKEAAALAMESGVDVQNYDYHNEEWETALKDALDEGLLTMDALDRAVGDVLRVKLRMGLFEDPFAPESSVVEIANRNREDEDLALRAARESMVLIKNDGLLPLPAEIGRLAVVGPAAAPALFGTYCDPPTRGAWNAEDHGGEGLLTGLRRALPDTEIRWEPGCAFDVERKQSAPQAVTQFDSLLRNARGSETGDEGIARAVEAARASELVIAAVGDQPWLTSGEGKDSAAAVLPGRQPELLAELAKAGRPIVLVLFTDRPVVITREVEAAGAALFAFMPGWRGGTAIAEVLAGKVNPGGRLPWTLPAHPCVVPLGADSRLGHRRYRELKEPVLRPFGFGLSYTSFAYRDLHLSRDVVARDGDVEVRVTVANTGARAGEEVILCRLVQERASIELRGSRLCGFRREHLEPGESRTVSFCLGSEDLAIFGADLTERVEPGRRTVTVGELSARFEVR